MTPRNSLGRGRVGIQCGLAGLLCRRIKGRGGAWCGNRWTGYGKPNRRRPQSVTMCYHREKDP